VSKVILEPYNAMLSMHQLMENSNGSYCIDNETLCDICFRNSHLTEISYKDLNLLVSVSIQLWECLYSSTVFSWDMTSTFVRGEILIYVLTFQFKNYLHHTPLATRRLCACQLGQHCFLLCHFQFIISLSYHSTIWSEIKAASSEP
jgi:hypothetical protein